MKKLFLTLLLPMFFGSVSYAQLSDTNEVVPPLADAPISNCKTPKLLAQAVLLYESSASLFVEFEENKELSADFMLYYSNEQGDELAIKVSNNKALLNNLKPNVSYKLSTTSTCDERVTIAEAFTAFNPEQIATSEKLFNRIAEWGVLQDKPRLFEFLKNQDDIDFYERLSYIQQYYFDGKSLADDARLSQTFPVPTYNKSGDCQCKWTVIMVNYVNPNATSQVNGFIAADNAQPYGAYNTNTLSHWKDRYRRGPAHKDQVWCQGRCTGGFDNSLMNDENLGYAYLAFNLVCEGVQGMDCSCKHAIRLAYNYQTEMTASAQTVGNATTWLCGSKSASAFAEEYAVLTATDQYGNIQVLDAAQMKVGAQCNRTLNTQFLANAAGLAGSIASIVVTATAASSGSGTGTSPVTTQQVSTLTTGIQNLIQTPINTSVTSCALNTKSGNLLNSVKMVQITANNAMRITLTSKTNLSAGGVTAWNSDARSSSNFYLVGLIGARDPLISYDKGCCTDRAAQWVCASSQDCPGDDTAMRSGVGAFLGLYGPWTGFTPNPFNGQINVAYDYNRISGPKPNDCNPAGRPMAETIYDVAAYQEGVYLKSLLPTEDFKAVNIYNTSGQLIFAQSLNLSYGGWIWNYSAQDGNTVPSGIYIVNLQKSTGEQVSFKISKVN